MDHKKVGAELRLRKLAVDLKKAYAKVARHIAETISPIEVALVDIGEPWQPLHYAESLLEHGADGALRPSTCFAHETFVNGDEADYVLCVAQGPDRKCGLYVSACRYHVGAATPTNAEDTSGNKQVEVQIKNTVLAPPASLPVALRLKILDVLDEFAEAYEEHVRTSRKTILSEFGKDTDTKLGAMVELPEQAAEPALAGQSA